MIVYSYFILAVYVNNVVIIKKHKNVIHLETARQDVHKQYVINLLDIFLIDFIY